MIDVVGVCEMRSSLGVFFFFFLVRGFIVCFLF